MKRINRFLVTGVLICVSGSLSRPAQADPIGIQWPQPSGLGTDVFVTYSYSNLLDGTFMLLGAAELRAATEEALRLWATYAPLHFTERPDSGPPPSDISYPATDHPQIRIGHHPMSELAHAYYPVADGLGGDVHFDPGIPWSVGEGHWNFLEAVTHELGHSLGLGHELDTVAIMNPSYPQRRFHGPGTAFLFPTDIENLQAIYGTGRGSVRPLAPVPEPAMFVLVATGAVAIAARVRRRR